MTVKVETIGTRARWGRLKKLVAGVAASALAAGMFVAAGVGIQAALAASPAPDVSVTEPESYIAGEDLTLDITFTGAEGAGAQYNLSAGVVISDQVEVLDTGNLGTPKIYTATDPETVLTGMIVPGAPSAETCEALGLKTPAPGAPAGSCAVAPGTQYLVFQNISDLPEGASATHNLTLRPKASAFEVGDVFPYQVNAYTSSVPRYIPVFPGSTGVNNADAQGATSNTGVVSDDIDVNALRIEKSEPSEESELLRGVHSNTTTYTLRVYHTGEGDITNTTVTDYLPAGLEYLGLGGFDNTTDANGNRGGGENSLEYDGAERLSATPAPDGDPLKNAAVGNEESVVTVLATYNEATGEMEEGSGDVYTKVTWNLADLLKATDGEKDIETGVAQGFPASAGTPGFLEIRYRAAIPLFENSYIDGEFDEDTSGPHGAFGQAANLDNNTGASTRHGINGESHEATVYVNTARAQGTWKAGTPDEATVSDTDQEDVHAVDVRVLKEVEVGEDGFVQGETARYTLNIATSEYVSAELSGPGDRLFDELGDGLCPVFPTDTLVTPGASTAGEDIPRLVLGNLKSGDVGEDLTVEEWKDALAEHHGIGLDCAFPSPKADNDATGTELVGATLNAIAFDPESGHFFIDLKIEPLEADLSEGIKVQYSAAQNAEYSGDNHNGATTSADVFSNEVQIQATTTAIPAVRDLENSEGVSAGNVEQAWDDSDATFQASLVEMQKHVLKRSAGVPDRHNIEEIAEANWVKTPEENEPFAVGDEVWYRINIKTPLGADVRNAVFTDFLPAGVEFDTTQSDSSGRMESTWITLPPADELEWIGDCAYDPEDEGDATSQWLNTFIPNPVVSGDVLTFTLGSNECIADSDDRFLPLNTPIEIYIKVQVTDAEAFGQVDLAQNLAKYQQANVAGEIFFLRSEAETAVATTPKLVKGIRDINGATDEPQHQTGFPFNSNVDNLEVAQKDQVTFRVDVTTPVRGLNPVTGAAAANTATSGYVVWDALPDGIKKADIGDTAVKLAERAWTDGDPDAEPDPIPAGWMISPEVAVAADKFTAVVVDFGDDDYPAQAAVREDIWNEKRSLIMWTVNAAVPASNDETVLVDADGDETDVVVPRTERGFSLQYVVNVPDGSTTSAEALITQQYENTASIVSYQPTSNASTPDDVITSTVIMTGDNTLSTTEPAEENPSHFGVSDQGTFDDSDIYLADATIAKTLVSSQIGPGGDLTGDPATNNAANQIVQGEFVTFDYTVTVPANTSVPGGRLVDLSNLRQFTGQTGGTATGTAVPYFVQSVDYFYNKAGESRTSVTCGTGDFADFECDLDSTDPAGHGALLFPDVYQNENGVAEQFTARITMWVEQDLTHGRWLENTARFDYIDPNAEQPTGPGSVPVRNSMQDSDRVQYIEPSPSLGKAVTGVTDRDDVSVLFDPSDPIVPESGSVTYTLTASNESNRPALFDGVVYDCVPAGLLLDSPNFTTNNGTATVLTGVNCELDDDGNIVLDSNGIPADAGEGTVIRWNLANPVRPGAANNATLSYTATVDSSAGGGQVLPNGVHLRGYTIPANIDGSTTVVEPATDRRDSRDSRAREEVRLASAGLTKTVSPEQAPVGDTVTYTITTTLPADANYYDVALWDQLPVGVEYVTGQTPTVAFGDSWPETGPAAPPTITGPTVTGDVSDGQRLDWTIAPQDIGTFTEARTITVTFDAKIVAEPTLAATPRNTAYLAWNNVDGNDDTRHEVPATADVTILNPEVDIEKKIDFAGETPIDENSIEVNPDETFDYQLRVFQTANGNTPAENVVVVDNVPAGVIIDTDTLTVDGAAAGGQVAWDSGVETGAGGTITWTLTGTLHQQAGAGTPKQILLGYSGEFIDSTELSAEAYENYVNVTSYESFEEDGWVYTPPQRDADGDLGTAGTKPGGANVPAANDAADVTPLFPQVDPVKTVSPLNLAPGQQPDGYGLAYLDTPFNWTLTITNNGDGAASAVDVIDTLPANWDYVAGTVQIDGIAYPDFNPTSSGSVEDGLVLTWTAGALGGEIDDLFPLEAGDSFVITFDAKPTEDAIDDPGTGLPSGGPAHTNTVAVDNVKDTQGNTENADVDSYAGRDSTADAYIAEADLLLQKTAIGGTDDDIELSNGNTLPAGSWVPGATDGATIGESDVTYTQPQWQLTVNNFGPDASFGPFELNDTQTLPTGVEVLPASWKALYFSDADDTEGTEIDINVTGTGTTDDPFELTVGDSTTSLSAGPKVAGEKTAGEDRIVITADVSIAAGAVATGNQLMNVADVVGQTFERESNQDEDADNPNIDEAAKPLVPVADLAIVKTIATAAADRGAGKPISWTLQVTNNGPSTSLSGTAKITVTDEIPDGIIGVADPSNATWSAALNGVSPWPADTTADAGDTITWTYAGASITPQQSIASITLSGYVETDWQGEIENIAEVGPGDTPDPYDPNNESEVPFTPGTDTTISIDKTRVVKNDAGDWVAAGSLDPVPAPVPGENVSYRITVTNHGPAVARGVHVTDELEDYLTFVSKEDVVGEWTTTNVAGDSDLRFNLTDPSPLASPIDLEVDDESNVVQFILTAKLDSDFVLDDDSVVYNQAIADADNADPVDDDDSSNAPSRDARLTIEKTHTGDPIAGTAIPYTLTVTNNGPSASRGPIVITDELPSGLSYVAGSATASIAGATAVSIDTEVSAEGDLLTWEVGDASDVFTLPVNTPTVNGTIVITLNVLIDSEITNGVKLNTATVDGPDGPPDEDTDEIEVEREADMSLTKKVETVDGDWEDVADVVAGDQVRYLLTVTNEGPSANPANLIDELPTHLTLVSVTPLDDTGWDCSASVVGSQLASCTNPLVPVGTTEFMVVTELAAEAVAGEANQTAEFVNEATLTWVDRNTTDPDTPNTSEDDAKIIATAEADLLLQKQVRDVENDAWADAAPATAGEQATYRVDVRNDGPSDVIAPIKIEDLLPVGVTFDELTSAQTLAFWHAEAGAVDETTGQQTVVFTTIDETIGLPSGESLPPLRYIVDIDPTAVAGDALVNSAEVTSGTTETDVTNNADSARIDVQRQVDLGIVKSHDADRVRITDELPFRIDVTNYGPSEASGIEVADEIPAGLEVVSTVGPVLDEHGDATGWTIDSITLSEPGDDTVDPVIPANPAGGATVIASYADPLAPGETAAPLVITTLVTADAYDTVTNVVTVEANEPEPDPDTENPNRDEDPVIVPPQVTLVVEKTAVGDFQVGKNGVYQITVDNLGPTADPGPITVTDVLPNGLTYVDSPNLPAGVSVATSGKTVTWTIENGLAIGERSTLQLTVHVAQAAYPEVTNVVTVDSPAEKTPESVLQDDETVPVAEADALVVTGGEFAAGLIIALALMLLAGAAAYAAGRRNRHAAHAE